ncbi:MAG: HD-GYP domain-containing protein [Gemmatimonadales bacterium]|nr:HD-GYP domain-containing protein [Gemmatimonadales bacterium]
MTAVVVVAIALATIAWLVRGPFPGGWGIGVLIVAGFLLELSASNLRGGDGSGSLAFLVNLSAGILFGPFWGGVVAVSSNTLGQLHGRRPAIKATFNIAQTTVALVTSVLVYRILGGGLPPNFLQNFGTLTARQIVPEALAFLTAALTFFLVNSVLVSGAVAITRRRSVWQVWQTNTLWVLGYDIGASTLALLVAWLYLRFDGTDGISRLGFLAVFAPIIGAKHIYTKLNTLQKLYDELDGAYDKLELNLREQLEMMVKSIEARDPYTSGHSRRVAALSKAIATDLGLEAQLVDEIENAALLHDVGKIHAEFAPLLSKEGRLTEEEWEIMKTHSTKSAELVALFSRFQGNVLESVRGHHERWDGKGYPHGIAREEIPLGARIIMVSDTIDAMSTDRPYRKALSFEKVTAELIKYRGIQFDPALVDATVNSVTVRRMVSDPTFLAEQTTTIKPSARKSRPALRSQSSFWEGLRSAVGSQEP